MISYNPFNASGILIISRISEVTWLGRTYIIGGKLKKEKLVIKIDFYVHHCEIFRVKREKLFVTIFFFTFKRDQKRDFSNYKFSSICLSISFIIV